MFLWGKRDGEEKRIEKIQRENGISENFEKGAFLVKRGERLFFCRGKKMMVLRRACCIGKGQGDFLVLDFGEEVFFGLRVWFDFEEKKTWDGIGKGGGVGI